MTKSDWNRMPIGAVPRIHVEPDRSVAVPETSWWTTASPIRFTARAEAECRRMRQSKEHFRIGLRLLQ